MAKTFPGFAAIAAALASSSSVHCTLIADADAPCVTSTPNQPLASVSPTTPPSECPTTMTGSRGITSATAAASEPNEYRSIGADRP